MSEKIYIKKEKINYRLILFALLLYGAAGMYDVTFYSEYGRNICSVEGAILGGGIFWLVLFVMTSRNNNIIRNGQVVWAKVDRSKCAIYNMGIVIRAGYFWKDKKQFVEYVGRIRTILDIRHQDYASKMEGVKYVPVFVDNHNPDKYVMVLVNMQFTQDEINSYGSWKDVIRVIDDYNANCN